MAASRACTLPTASYFSFPSVSPSFLSSANVPLCVLADSWRRRKKKKKKEEEKEKGCQLLLLLLLLLL
jgi:hypothetical protein